MIKAKDFLLAEKGDLERIIADIPADCVLDKLSFEARLKKVNDDLFYLDESKDPKKPEDSIFERLKQLEAQIQEVRDRLSAMEDAYRRQERECFGTVKPAGETNIFKGCLEKWGGIMYKTFMKRMEWAWGFAAAVEYVFLIYKQSFEFPCQFCICVVFWIALSLFNSEMERD